MERGNFEGEGESHRKVYAHSVVICAKTAEPIEMPFGFWPWMGSSNHVLDGFLIPMRRGNLREKGRPLQNIGTFCRELYETAESIEMPFGLWVGARKHALDGAQIPHAN